MLLPSLESIVIYALICWFAFYLVNHSDLLAKPRAWLIPHLAWWAAYSLQCGFCFTFWLSVGLYFAIGIAPMYAVTTPVITLLINLAYLRLRPETAAATPPTLPPV